MARTPAKKVAAQKAAEAEETAVYEVVSPLRRNGEKFAIGDEIALTATEAENIGIEVVKPASAGAKTE